MERWDMARGAHLREQLRRQRALELVNGLNEAGMEVPAVNVEVEVPDVLLARVALGAEVGVVAVLDPLRAVRLEIRESNFVSARLPCVCVHCLHTQRERRGPSKSRLLLVNWWLRDVPESPAPEVERVPADRAPKPGSSRRQTAPARGETRSPASSGPGAACSRW